MKGFKTQLEAFLYWEKKIPDQNFLNQPIDGSIMSYSFASAGEEARKIAQKLKDYDLAPHSHIALLSKNCAHWHIADLAIMMAGHVSIPLYPTLTKDSINMILNHSESKVIIAGKLDDYEDQQKGFTDIPRICVGLYGIEDGEQWEDIVLEGEEISELYTQKPDDLYTIIYTSGTTGDPKGVMHSVNNFMESVYGLNSIFDVKDNSRVFSYLPIAHVAERILENISFVFGCTVNFPESLATYASDLEKSQPQLFFAVPRIWSKFREKILEKLPQNKLRILLLIPGARQIIKSTLKKKLGLAKAEFILSGAAPIEPELVKWYASIGIRILQVYGMTEDGCISHCNIKKANRIGSVGKKLPNVEIKFGENNEILIRNKCLMKGYYKAPELTASSFDEEGYFKTGDIGEYDHDGFLTLTGRAKDQFKTDKGKYISPGPLELKMAQNQDIEQICIVGTGIPQPIALITLSESGLSSTKEDLIRSFKNTLLEVNPEFEKHEKIEKVVIMKENWDLSNGLITPTLKIKRNAIEKIHQPYYKFWFDNEELIIFE